MVPRRTLRHLRSLADPAARRETGLFLVEGERLARTVRAAGLPLDPLLVREGRGDLLREFPGAIEVPVQALRRASTLTTPPPILGAAPIPEAPRPGQLAALPAVLALDGVQDPGNVGSLLRCADAFGVKGVVTSGDTADVWSPKVVRASMGAVLGLALARVASLADVLDHMRKRGVRVLGTAAAQGEDPRSMTAPERWCLVLGGEGEGVSEPVRAEVDGWLTVPIAGQVGSLGVAAAGAICMAALAPTRSRGGD